MITSVGGGDSHLLCPNAVCTRASSTDQVVSAPTSDQKSRDILRRTDERDPVRVDSEACSARGEIEGVDDIPDSRGVCIITDDYFHGRCSESVSDEGKSITVYPSDTMTVYA
jgi:hypothetical protein